MNLSNLKVLSLLILFTLLVSLYGQNRKQFDPTVETRLTFSYNFSDPMTMIATVLTTSPNRTNNTFFFESNYSTAKTPRILSAVKVVNNNEFNGTAYFPPLKLADPQTNVSAHYFRIYNDTGFNYTISASRTIRTWDFPLLGELYEPYFADPADLPSRTEFLTISYQSFVYHDSIIPLKCQYTVDYTGIIRSIFFNDDRKGQFGVQNDDILSENTYTSGPVFLDGKQMVVVTVIGYRLNLKSLYIVNCQNNDGLELRDVPVNFNYYTSGRRITLPQPITYRNQTSECQTSATRCIDKSRSYDCAFNFYRGMDTRCHAFCPQDELTVTAYDDCSNFTYEEIRRGYKTAPEAANKANTDFSYYVDLQQGSEVLTIFWPSENYTMTPTTIWFPDEKSLFFSEAVITTHTVPASGVLKYSVPLKLLQDVNLAADALRTVTYTHYEMITDPRRALMMVAYDKRPTTEEEKKTPRSFTYAPHDHLLELNNQTFMYVSTYLNCIESCEISVLGSGHIEGFKNYKTFLFAMDYGNETWTYTLPTTFTGLVWLTFTVQNASAFKLTVIGRNYKIFSHGFPLTKQTLSLSQSNSVLDSTSVSCRNGEDGVCFSCKKGYFLNPVTKTCVANCPAGYLTYLPDRKCFRSKCRPHTLLLAGDICIPECQDGRFYIEGQGCHGECFKGCNTCTNNTGICLDCAYKDPVSSIAQCSHCPIGTAVNAKGSGCVSSSALSIMGPKQIYKCADLILTASMNPVEELYLAPLTFSWDLKSATGRGNTDELKATVRTQKRKELIIPSDLLTPGAKYTFTVKYTNVINKTISSSFTTAVVASPVPEISIDGGGDQVFYHYDDNILKMRVQYSQGCFNFTQALQVDWQQIGGPTVDTSSDRANMPSPFWLAIPKCKLLPGTNYSFQAEAMLEGSSGQKMTYTTNFRVPPVNYTVSIENGNRDHPVGTDLALQGMLNYKVGDCQVVADATPVSYLWTCEVKNTTDEDIGYDKCSMDTRGLFDKGSLEDSLKIPSSYFRENQTLRIGVIATKGSDKASTSVTFDIKSNKTLIFAVQQKNFQLNTYPKELMFVGNVLSEVANDNSTNYAWAVNPRLFNASFLNLYKVIRDDTLIGKKMMKVLAKVNDKNNNTASSFVDIPVDPAPNNGKLTITPNSGYSLSTYFHISAVNWEDDDAPLTYEFFYTFGDGVEYRLTDKQKFPFIYTMLPANTRALGITIRVLVTDSLGAQTSAEATVGITSRGDNIIDALNTFRSAFGGITFRGDPSVSKGDSLEMLKTLSFMTKEMSTFENLTDSYLPGKLNETDRTHVIGFKMAMIDNLRIVHASIPTPDTDEILLQTISSASYNTVFNLPSSVMLMAKVMGANMGKKTNFSNYEVNATTEIINNFIANFGSGGFSFGEDDTEKLRDFTEIWLNKVSHSTMIDKIPGERPILVNTKNVDFYMIPITGCDLIRLPIKTSVDSAAFSFNVISGHQDDPELSCSAGYNLVYYAFNPNKTSAQNATQINTQKSMVSFGIFNLSGEQVDLPLTYTLTINDTCPAGCVSKENSTCRCTNYKTFELGNVLDRLFGIEHDEKFDVWWTVPFWATIISGAWLLLTWIIVMCIMPRYCKFARFKAMENKTNFRAFRTTLWITHKFFNIYTYYDEYLPKSRRASLYFLRIQFFSAMACIISLWSDEHTGIVDLIKEFIVYVVVIPYVTIYIIHALLEVLVRSYRPNKFSYDSDGGQRSQESSYTETYSSSNKKPNNKCVFFLGILICLALTAGALFYTWYTGLQAMSKERRNGWAVCLVLAVVIDLLITPIVLLFVHYIFSVMYATKAVQSSGFFRRLFRLPADDKIIAIRQELANKKKNALRDIDVADQKPLKSRSIKKNKNEKLTVGRAIPEVFKKNETAKRPYHEKEVGKRNNPYQEDEEQQSVAVEPPAKSILNSKRVSNEDDSVLNSLPMLKKMSTQAKSLEQPSVYPVQPLKLPSLNHQEIELKVNKNPTQPGKGTSGGTESVAKSNMGPLKLSRNSSLQDIDTQVMKGSALSNYAGEPKNRGKSVNNMRDSGKNPAKGLERVNRRDSFNSSVVSERDSTRNAPKGVDSSFTRGARNAQSSLGSYMKGPNPDQNLKMLNNTGRESHRFYKKDGNNQSGINQFYKGDMSMSQAIDPLELQESLDVTKRGRNISASQTRGAGKGADPKYYQEAKGGMRDAGKLGKNGRRKSQDFSVYSQDSVNKSPEGVSGGLNSARESGVKTGKGSARDVLKNGKTSLNKSRGVGDMSLDMDPSQISESMNSTNRINPKSNKGPTNFNVYSSNPVNTLQTMGNKQFHTPTRNEREAQMAMNSPNYHVLTGLSSPSRPGNLNSDAQSYLTSVKASPYVSNNQDPLDFNRSPVEERRVSLFSPNDPVQYTQKMVNIPRNAYPKRLRPDGTYGYVPRTGPSLVEKSSEVLLHKGNLSVYEPPKLKSSMSDIYKRPEALQAKAKELRTSNMLEAFKEMEDRYPQDLHYSRDSRVQVTPNEEEYWRDINRYIQKEDPRDARMYEDGLDYQLREAAEPAMVPYTVGNYVRKPMDSSSCEGSPTSRTSYRKRYCTKKQERARSAARGDENFEEIKRNYEGEDPWVRGFETPIREENSSSVSDRMSLSKIMIPRRETPIKEESSDFGHEKISFSNSMTPSMVPRREPLFDHSIYKPAREMVKDGERMSVRPDASESMMNTSRQDFADKMAKMLEGRMGNKPMKRIFDGEERLSVRPDVSESMMSASKDDFNSRMSKIQSKPDIGPKIRMSADGKPVFEVKLGKGMKGPCTNNNCNCNHHETD